MIAMIRTTSIGVCLLLTLFLTGCASPSQPSRFYRLDSQLPLVKVPEPRDGSAITLIGVGPVMLASYLDRPQIVERTPGYGLDLHEFDRWAGTLQENIVQVLVNVMQQRMPHSQVIAYPWNPNLRPDYELMLYISRFDRQAGQLRLQARWSLVSAQGNRLVRLAQSEIEIPVEGAGVEAVVAASSQALQQLGREIAAGLPMRVDERH
ncbi:MAG: PqiC family protein [Candidatus Thiodiazotropha sp.]